MPLGWVDPCGASAEPAEVITFSASSPESDTAAPAQAVQLRPGSPTRPGSQLKADTLRGAGEEGGAAKKGEVDLVALGMEDDVGFEVTPAEGVLQPGEQAEFSLTFTPKALKRCVLWSQALVCMAEFNRRLYRLYWFLCPPTFLNK